jgi:hypothetical protein
MEDSNSSSPIMDVTLRVLVCGGSDQSQNTLTFNIKRHADTRQVFQRVLDQLGIGPKAAAYCALFEMIEASFAGKNN